MADMKQFIGTKLVKAKRMYAEEASALLNRPITTDNAELDPKDPDNGHPGFLVEYPDGYQSWSPEKQFVDAYRPMEGMTFGLAIEALKFGLMVARAGWNGKGMFLALIHPGNAMYTKGGVSLDMQECIGMKTADPRGHMQPGWLASQADMLAEDWQIVK